MKRKGKIAVIVTFAVSLLVIMMSAYVYAGSVKVKAKKWNYVAFTNESNTFTEPQWIDVSEGSNPGAYLNLKSDNGGRAGIKFYQNDPNRPYFEPDLSWSIMASEANYPPFSEHLLMFQNEYDQNVLVLNQDKSADFHGPISVFTDFNLIDVDSQIRAFSVHAQNGAEYADIIVHKLWDGATGAHVAVADGEYSGPGMKQAFLHITGGTPTVQVHDGLARTILFANKLTLDHPDNHLDHKYLKWQVYGPEGRFEFNDDVWTSGSVEASGSIMASEYRSSQNKPGIKDTTIYLMGANSEPCEINIQDGLITETTCPEVEQ